MIAATISEAIPSAWSKPVVRMTSPAIAVKTKAARSVRMCWKAPSTLSESRFAFDERPGRDQVDDDPEDCDREDDPALDVGRIDQPPDPLVDDQQPEHEQGGAVELGAEDAGALPAERQRPAGRAGGEADRDQRQDQGAGVGQHVGRVGEQRQRVGDDPDDHLDRHEPEDQRQGDRQLRAIGIGGDRVRMAGVRGMVVSMLGRHGHEATRLSRHPQPTAPAVSGYDCLAARRRNLSTRPPVSTSFCLPV